MEPPRTRSTTTARQSIAAFKWEVTNIDSRGILYLLPTTRDAFKPTGMSAVFDNSERSLGCSILPVSFQSIVEDKEYKYGERKNRLTLVVVTELHDRIEHALHSTRDVSVQSVLCETEDGVDLKYHIGLCFYGTVLAVAIASVLV